MTEPRVTSGELRLVRPPGGPTTTPATPEELAANARVVFDNLVDAVLRVDDRGIVCYATPSSLAVIGLQPDRIVGERLADLVDPADASVIDFLLDESTRSQEPLTSEVSPGAERALHDAVLRVTVRSVDRPNGLEHHVVVRDVSDRKRVERQLSASKQRLEALIGQISDMVAVLDPMGSFSYVNPAVESSTGYPASFLVGRSPLEFIDPADHEVVVGNLAKVVAGTNDRKGVQYRVLHRDGSVRWFESVGRNLLDDPAIGGLVISARDVTAARSAKEQAEQATELLGSVMRAASSEAIIVTDRAATVIGFSRGAEDLFGLRAADLVGWSPVSVLHDGDDVDRLAAEIGVTTAELFMLPPADGTTHRSNMLFVRADGGRFPGSLRVTERTGGQGEHLGFLYVVTPNADEVARAA